MDNKFYIFISWILVVFMVTISCSNKAKRDSKVVIVNDSIRFNSDDKKLVHININDLNIYCKSVSQLNESLLSLVKVSNIDKREIALVAYNNKSILPIEVNVEGVIDTIVNVPIMPYYVSDDSRSISGNCAPLNNIFATDDNTIEMKKWLFKHKVHISEDHIQTIVGIYNELSKKNVTELHTTQDVPVIKSFAGLSYKVSSKKHGDYYILYACSTSDEIEDFVSEIIANNFELCSTSLSQPLSCFRAADSNGYKCICLISIKKDWQYSIEPLGLVAIDNIAPVRNKNSFKDTEYISFPNNIKVTIPNNKPLIHGYADVSISNWDGTGLSCNCTFNINYSGDVCKVVIHRRGTLAKWLSKQDKTIILSEVSNPFTFTYELHFEDGDNLIPITIYDYHGNSTSFELNINAKFVRNNTSDINIDNNINVW